MRTLKIGSGIFILGLAASFLTFLLRDTRPEGTAELMEALQEAPVNSVIRLSDYLHAEASEVCLLTPYQDSISLEESRNAVKVNTRIKEEPFSYDLDQFWKLALLQRDKIEFVRINIHKFGKFKRNKFEASERKFFSRVTFTKKNCADFLSAAFVKFGSDDRIFFIFGSLSNGLRRK